MEQSKKHIRRFGKFADDTGQQRVLRIYDGAIETLRKRIEEEGKSK